jgi:putative hydrolase of the HAD superfamily
MIRAIFFDGGGVIAHFDPGVIDAYERAHGLGGGEVVRVLYEGTDWIDAERGTLDEDTWLMNGLTRFRAEGRPLEFRDLRETWDKAFLKLDRQVLALVERLAESYRVGLLTNSSSSQQALERKLAGAGILNLWHTIVNSSDVGVTKPDERIYKIAAARFGLEPAECIHIDDKAENVAGAVAAGFSAIHFTGDFGALEARLQAIGVEIGTD